MVYTARNVPSKRWTAGEEQQTTMLLSLLLLKEVGQVGAGHGIFFHGHLLRPEHWRQVHDLDGCLELLANVLPYDGRD